jgi:hypothetical protein
MDGDKTNGIEISEASRIVNVISANKTGENFTLTNGFDISGTLRVDSGLSDSGRTLVVSLQNQRAQTVAETQVNLVGTSVNFTLQRVTPGDYVISVQDYEYPRKYSAKQVGVTVLAANVTIPDVPLLKSAKIKGRLQNVTSGELITSNNYSNILPQDFYVNAYANPWFPGGYGNAAYPIIQSDDMFSIDVAPGTYNIDFGSQNSISQSDVASGKKSFVPKRLSGITVEAGQTLVLPDVKLTEGIQISGTITNEAGTALPNIQVEVFSNSDRHGNRLQAYTDHLGKYTLFGISPEDFVTIVASPRPDNHDQRFSLGFQGTRYGEVRRSGIDTRKIVSGAIKNIDFKLQIAAGSVTGTVTTPDGGELIMPFEEQAGVSLPGAEIILNRQGEVPEDNPLGNIDALANPDGSFSIKGLLPGVYSMWILARGYGSAFKDNITVNASDVNVGTVTLVAGAKLSGTITKVDGSLLNENDVNAVLAVRNGFEEVIVGALTSDAGKSITRYTLSGFQADKTYSVILLGEEDDITLLGSGIKVNSSTEQNFVVTDKKPEIFAQAFKNTDGSYNLRFELTKALRNSSIDADANSQADDSEPAKIIRVTNTANLTFSEDWISSNRKRIVATYTPSAGETSVVVTASVTFVSIDPASGNNYQRTKVFTLPLGVGKTISQRVTNANGGTVALEGDTSEVAVPAGTFGDDASLEVEMTVNAADDVDEFTTSSVRHQGHGIMSNFKEMGLRAYPTGMARGLSRLHELDVDPFGSFYEILLPAGVSHSFPSGKEARMCLSYDTTVSNTDAYSLNVYYFNEATNEYLLENTKKTVDTDNQRICVSLSHASVFTVLNSSMTTLAGGAYAGELTVMNFPNPFNLKTKTLTLQDPGSASASQTIEGTMIKVSAPAGIGGALEIGIYSVTGERVRTISGSITAGSHNYIEWDGKNDGGQKVASGAYFARMTISGGNEKFFKMAVLK